MLDKIIEKFKNKNIGILGFGREGMSTYKFLRNHLKSERITIIDKNTNIKDNEIFNLDSNISFKLGEDYLNGLETFDIIVKTAGISLNHIDNTKYIDKIVSQYSLILEETDFKVIGVTGTKGKSTTSTLMYEILKDQGKKVMLLGNIGVPVFDYIEDITMDTILVLELSAYQLEYVKKAPHISILLNLHEEHLDYFGSIDKYYNSKLNILNKQTKDDYGFYLSDNSNYIDKNYKSNLFSVGKDIFIEDNYVCINYKGTVYKLYNIFDERKLLGVHNLTNIMFVLGVSYLLKLNMDKVRNTINNFKGLEHRMELVGTYDGVIFYNDTIATIPDATINAIESIGIVDTLILGGMDRGIDYLPLINYLKESKVNNIICMPETGNKIGNILKGESNKKIYFEEDMEKVVKLAKQITNKGTVCLLSPAAPSYNKYKNFEEKGRIYKEIIKR